MTKTATRTGHAAASRFAPPGYTSEERNRASHSLPPGTTIFASRFRRRRLQPELMDQPGLAPAEHAAALAGLRRLNAASRTATSVWRAIRASAPMPTDRPLRVLDLACGGGDLVRDLCGLASRAGVPIETHGVDLSETAIEYARGRTPEGVSASFSVCDTLADPLPTGYDVITSSLFLHHLTEADAVVLLRKMAEATAGAIVVSDLLRSAAGYWLAQLACRSLSRSPIVHYDGPRSVEGAFTLDEFRGLAVEAGLESVRVERVWPQRFLATWGQPGAKRSRTP